MGASANWQGNSVLTREMRVRVPPLLPTHERVESMENPSIVDFLESEGLRSDFASRKLIAIKYGINDYTGTAEQNLYLLGLLRGSVAGRLWAEIKAALKL